MAAWPIESQASFRRGYHGTRETTIRCNGGRVTGGTQFRRIPMAVHATVDQVVKLASSLSPLDKLRLIERLTPDLAAALAPASAPLAISATQEDDIYEAGYRNTPEDITEIEGLLPHLSIETERWE